MIELENQIQAKNKQITDIFVPGGTGCMASGVIFGAGALDRPFHINVITVEFNRDILKERLENYLIQISKVTGIKLKYSLDEIATVHGGYEGKGYPMPTKEGIAVIRELAETEGIFLEQVFTSKCFYGMKDLLLKGIVKSEGSCYIHSGGFSEIFYQFL